MPCSSYLHLNGELVLRSIIEPFLRIDLDLANKKVYNYIVVFIIAPALTPFSTEAAGALFIELANTKGR